MTPRIYKIISSEPPPTQDELIELGVNIVPQREDIVTVDKVSNALFNAVSGTPLRREE